MIEQHSRDGLGVVEMLVQRQPVSYLTSAVRD
jgi:hypothetical protein